MDVMRIDPNWVGVSIRLYRLLLLVYPSAFRREYGAPMLQVFGDRAWAHYRRSGISGLLGWWGWTMLDTVQAAIEEHTQRGVDMSKNKFEKLSGWALMLGGPAIFLGWLASGRPEYQPYNYYSQEIDRLANALDMPLIILGILLLVVGYAGLLTRYGTASGLLGRFGLGLGILSGLVSAVGAASNLFFEAEFQWQLFIWGMFFQFTGLVIFGLACLRRRVLPRWHGLPLLAGMWMPLLLLASMIYEAITGNWLDLTAVDFGFWLVSLTCLAGVGYVLLSSAGVDESLQATPAS
jgi:hypothetical protein